VLLLIAIGIVLDVAAECCYGLNGRESRELQEQMTDLAAHFIDIECVNQARPVASGTSKIETHISGVVNSYQLVLKSISTGTCD
jgi:hypothetical protein